MPALSAKAITACGVLLRAIPFALGIVGLAVVAGWVVDVPAFTRLVPAWAAMKPNTALSFILAAVALWQLRNRPEAAGKRKRRWLARVAAGLVLAIGLGTLVEQLWRIDLGIDDLIVRNLGVARVGDSLRMSPLIAVDLVLLSVGTLLLSLGSARKSVWLAQALALAAAFGAFIAVAGYLLGPETLGQATFFTSTALHTALTLVIWGMGVMCARPADGFMALCNADSAGGTVLRRLLPPVVILPLSINWLELACERRGLIPVGFGTMLDAALTVFLAAAIVWGVTRLVHEKDVTRQAAEIALRQSEERYRQLVEMSPVAIVVKGERRIEFANQAACELVGATSADDVVGRSPFAFFHPESRAKFESDFHRVLREGMPLSPMEQKLVRQDGREIDVELSAALVHYQGQRLAQVVARDITERKCAERALRESEERFRLIAETITEVFWMADVNINRIVYISPSYARVWGRSCQSLYENPRSFLEAIHPDDLERVMAGLEVQRRGLPFDHEYRVLHPDGSIRWIWDRGFPVRTDDGPVIHFVGVAQDVSARKRAEAELHATIERFELLARTTGDAVWDWNAVTNKSWWSETYYEKYGFLQGTAPTVDAWVSHVHPDDRERARREFNDAVARKTAFWSSEYRYRRTDGTYAVVFDRAHTIFDASGKIVRMIGSMIEISELRRLEADVKLLAHAIESTNEMISITDLDDRFIFVNRAFLTAYRYRIEEVIGQTPALIAGSEVKSEELRAEIRALAEKEGWSGELVNRRKDGAEFPIRLSEGAVRDAQGKVIALMGVATDISERRGLELQLRQAQKMEAIGQLAGGVAHDFNNVLTAISGHTTLIALSQVLPPAAQESFDEIVRATQRAASLTRQLLLFSRREVMQPRALDLNEVVTQLARMLQRLIGEDISLKLRLHSRPLCIHADLGMIEQVLMNLAVNARDAMPSGGELAIETFERFFDPIAAVPAGVEAGRFACVSVSDTGCGIAREILPHIFEPFFTTKEADKGTGLGLATVFGIAKQHRGGVKVYSEPGQGATFMLLLPITDLPLERAAASERKELPRGRGEDVLLVEDDDAVRDITALMLERHGYRVMTASNGSEALRHWSESGGRFDLLLTDMVMPGGISGKELAEKLQEEKPGLKTIFASGYGAVIAGRALHLQPGQIFLQKPLEVSKLLLAIADLLHPRG